MPQNMDYELYFNIAFFLVIGFGFLVGYFRGWKKSLWGFVVTLAFYALFFATIDMVINQLWVMDVSFGLVYAEPFLPDLAGQTTIEGSALVMIQKYLGETVGAETMTNEVFLSFVAGIGQGVLKLVYTIIYFTAGQLIFRFITLILRTIFIGGNKKKDKKTGKKVKVNRRPLFGAIFGAAKGTVSAYMTLIILGGMLSFSQSMMQLIPEETAPTAYSPSENVYLTSSYDHVNVGEDLWSNYDVINPNDMVLYRSYLLASPLDVPAEYSATIDEARNMINAFEANIFVTTASGFTTTSDSYSEPVAMHLYLFDTVLSFTVDGNQIMLRDELDIIADAASIALNSEYFTSNDLSDITGAEIEQVFLRISDSELITTALPLAIEVGSDMYDTDIEIPVEELYDIDWAAEIQILGTVAAVGFDLINTAGLLVEDPDLETITLDGTEVKDLFDELGDSELATLGAYVAVEPLLEAAGADIEAIITVPDDIVWGDEFRAFGAVAEEVLNSGLTMADLQTEDPMNLINTLSEVDFTVLLGSQIATHALINILSGDAGIDGLDLLIIPDGINWLDTYDLDGNLIPGELRNILDAVNVITNVAQDFNLDNLDFNVIADFDDDTIDAIFESDILVASISDYLLNMDLGDTPLVIPDTALDANGYIFKVELKRVATSARLLVVDLACDEGDTACEDDMGFDIGKAFSLSDTSIDTLTSSEIIGATLGNLIIDNGGDILVIPTSALRVITVNSVPQSVVSNEEIKKIFNAIGVLGFTDLDNMTFDASIINNLSQEADATLLDKTKSDKLLASHIVQATLADMIIEQATGEASVLALPYYAEDDVTPIRYTTTEGIDLISDAELEDILQALISLEITDFAGVDGLDLDLVISNSAILLESSILQATISKQVFDLGSDIITVPYKDAAAAPIRVMVGSVVEETNSEYITKDEIIAVLDALKILNITDIQSFSGDVTLSDITAEPGNITIMLDSAILHATVSDQLIKLDTDGTIEVPVVKEDDVTPIRVTIGDVGFETEYIVKAEIEAMIDALDIIGILDVDSFDGSVDLAVIMEGTNKDIVLLSASIQATISKQLIDLDTDGTVTVPFFAEDDATEIRVTVGPVGKETEYITIEEIKDILDSVDALGFTDVEAFSGSVDLTLLNDPVTREIILASSTIQATISDQLIGLDTDGTLVLPYLNEDESEEIRFVVGDVLEGTDSEYVLRTEIDAIIDAVDALGFTDVEAFSGSVDLTILADPAKRAIVLASSTIQATISDQLIGLDTDGTLVLPYLNEDESEEIRFTVGDALEGTDTEYVLASEIDAIIDAVDALGFTDVEEFSGSVDLGLLSDPVTRTTVLASSTIQATISDQLIGLDTDGTLVLPHKDQTDLIDIRFVVGSALEGTETEYVLNTEIDAIIDAVDALGFTDVEAFSGSVDLGLLSDPVTRTTVLASSTIQATISDQLIGLDTDGTLVLPHFNEDETLDIRFIVGVVLDGTDTEYVLRSEIDKIIDAVDALGFTDVEEFSGSVDLGLLADPATRTTVLASSTIQATISDQLIGLDTDGTLVLPYFNEDETLDIRFMVGVVLDGTETEYVLRSEIDKIIDAVDALGFTDVEEFSGSVDLGLLADPVTRTTVLASSTIQATISDQLIGLDTDETIVLPYFNEDETVDIRFVVGVLLDGTNTEYVLRSEIDAMIDAMDVLGFTDVEAFSGSVDLGLLSIPANRATVLESSTIQATISKQIIDLTDNPTLEASFVVPFFAENNVTEIRFTVGDALAGTDSEFLLSTEIDAMIDGLNILGITDVETFDGSIDLTGFFDETNRNKLLASSVMQATISSQLIDLGDATLRIPQQDVNTVVVRVNVGDAIALTDTEYISEVEISAMFEALEALGITDVNDFSGTIDLNNVYGTTNQDLILGSSSMHATISKQMSDLGPSVLVIPDVDIDSVAVHQTVVGTYFINKTEIKSMIDSLELLGITDITTFDGNVDLSLLASESNQNTILSSASIHATISKQMFDLGPSVLVIPDQDVASVPVHTTLSGTYFIVKDEVKAMFNALDVLGIDDVQSFAGNVDLTLLADGATQDTILSSASVHATISKQMLDLDTGGTMTIPSTDIDGVAVELTVSGTYFVVKAEVKALFDALDVLGVTDVQNFDGAFDLTVLQNEVNQDKLLASASIHKTITDTMLDLDDAVLIVPAYTQVAEAPGNEVRLTVNTNEFVVKGEIKAIINAFNAMGYGDLGSFGGSIDSSKFFDDRITLLLSSSIQATLSSKLINDTGGELVVPNTNVAAATAVRLIHADVTYVDITEMNAILVALEELGLEDFGSMDFTLSSLLAVDFDLLLTSASIQATISTNILPSAVYETEPAGTTSLVVPTFFREDITVGVAPDKQIEKVELKAILTSLQTLGLSNFGDAMDASVITSLTDVQLDTVLASGSIHTTVDNMLRGNTNINTSIPDLAKIDAAYKTDIATTTEIKAFIKATTTVASGSFADVAFDLTAVANLSPAQQDVVLDSMIVRNILTPPLENIASINPFDLYPLVASDYTDNDIAGFLTEATILAIIAHYGL